MVFIYPDHCMCKIDLTATFVSVFFWHFFQMKVKTWLFQMMIIISRKTKTFPTTVQQKVKKRSVSNVSKMQAKKMWAKNIIYSNCIIWFYCCCFVFKFYLDKNKNKQVYTRPAEKSFKGWDEHLAFGFVHLKIIHAHIVTLHRR